jgi:hypothetical protein
MSPTSDPTVAAPSIDDPRLPRAVVFSHPNHEIALFGWLRRTRPPIVYLTDGGGEERVEQTRRGLAGIGCLDRATFLGHRETALYGALLDRDLPFWRRLAEQVRAALVPHAPRQVFCDAVELYNPVHDMSLPVTKAAVRACGSPAPATFEVPLAWQPKGRPDEVVLQRVPPSRRARAVSIRLDEAELDAKVAARDRVYGLLREGMGSPFRDASREQLSVEEVVATDDAWTPPDGDDVGMRYERRGRLLKDRGEHDRVITYADHWLPLADALVRP